MLLKTVKLSTKGQVTLPVEALRALHAKKGDEFVVVQHENRIVLIPAKTAAKELVDDLGGWSQVSEPAFARVWDNQEDEIWNEV